jgi:hypothetical protein
MYTLLGALLGFLGSIFPDILKYFRDNKDKAHELAIMDRQMEMTKLGHSQRLEEIQLTQEAHEQIALYKHAQPVGVAWVDALAGTVRPVITYAFFALYAGAKFAHWKAVTLALGSPHWHEALLRVWQNEDDGLFAAVMSFWFGHRALAKMRRK